MKDLDFDELDRAVNSLITNAPSLTSNADIPKETTLDLGNGSYDQIPVTSSVNSQPIAPTPSFVTVSPAVERPSTGRFMDVVHPSSDMRSNLVMPERNLNQAPELKPIAVPYSAPAAVVTPAPISSMPTPMSSNWASPSKPSEEANEADEDDDIDQIGNDIANAMEQNNNAPLDSPFLSGTKVDKRPLGAFSDDQKSAELENKPQDTSAYNSNPLLPAELQDDLLLIESNSTAQPDDAPDEKPVVESLPETPVVPAVPVVPILPIAPVTIETKPVTTTSITQQYKEQPNSGDQKTGAIYDTNSYHKALTPTKKKSGWLWVLWIVLLLIIGAGSGAAVYFLVLPNL